MATELAMAMRRLKAQEALAKEVAELNRKMDLVMAHLGIVDTPPADEVPSETVVDTPHADEASATGDEQ